MSWSNLQGGGWVGFVGGVVMQRASGGVGSGGSFGCKDGVGGHMKSNGPTVDHK